VDRRILLGAAAQVGTQCLDQVVDGPTGAPSRAPARAQGHQMCQPEGSGRVERGAGSHQQASRGQRHAGTPADHDLQPVRETDLAEVGEDHTAHSAASGSSHTTLRFRGSSH